MAKHLHHTYQKPSPTLFPNVPVFNRDSDVFPDHPENCTAVPAITECYASERDDVGRISAVSLSSSMKELTSSVALVSHVSSFYNEPNTVCETFSQAEVSLLPMASLSRLLSVPNLSVLLAILPVGAPPSFIPYGLCFTCFVCCCYDGSHFY